jgi:upstream activation factor subunit UAF30
MRRGDKTLLRAASLRVLPMKTVSQCGTLEVVFAPHVVMENRALMRPSPNPRTSTTYVMEKFKMATAKPPAKKEPPVKKVAVKTAAPAKKVAAEKTAAPAKKRTPNAAFMKALTLSPQLAAVIGAAPLPRTEVTKKIWEYIKAHKLQDDANKRMINADAKLKVIFGKDQVSMFEMTKLVNAHLIK